MLKRGQLQPHCTTTSEAHRRAEGAGFRERDSSKSVWGCMPRLERCWQEHASVLTGAKGNTVTTSEAAWPNHMPFAITAKNSTDARSVGGTVSTQMSWRQDLPLEVFLFYYTQSSQLSTKKLWSAIAHKGHKVQKGAWYVTGSPNSMRMSRRV